MQPYLIVNDMEVSPFDYMKQFWRENEVQMFSAKETQLYFFFLSESNRLYWRNPFGCSTQRITNNLGISRQTLCRLRKKLQDRGLITYEEGKNNSIVPCYGLLIKSKDSIMQNVTINGTQNGTVNVTPYETADGTIIKTLKTTDNESTISMEELFPLDRLQNILYDDSAQIKDIAQTVIKSEGMSYNVDVYFEKSYFPLKTYGDMSFPPGEYEAFRIDIGEAGGHNWWCVLFPPLCMVSQSYSVVHDDSKQMLKNVLSDEAYDTVTMQDLSNNRYRVRFKYLTFLNKLFD